MAGTARKLIIILWENWHHRRLQAGCSTTVILRKLSSVPVSMRSSSKFFLISHWFFILMFAYLVPLVSEQEWQVLWLLSNKGRDQIEWKTEDFWEWYTSLIKIWRQWIRNQALVTSDNSPKEIKMNSDIFSYKIEWIQSAEPYTWFSVCSRKNM